MADRPSGTEESLHAWVIRSTVRGTNLAPLWLKDGFCSLATGNMRPIQPGTPPEAILAAVDQEYRHMPYTERRRKTEEIDLFVNRVAEGDLVVANLGNRIHLGTVTGPANYRNHGDSRANLVRPVAWHTTDSPLTFDDLPDAVSGPLNTQYDVIDLTEFADHLAALLPGREPVAPPVEFQLPDAPATLADQLHLPLTWLQQCVVLLRDRPQLILTGPPGTGKTYVAKALARALTSRANVKIVQFHPAYAYEDFVEGYRPVAGADGSGQVGFELRGGPLRILAERARQNPEEGYFLVIDEINRTDIAKVFGELYFLLEYRDEAVDLQYSSGDHVGFTLPKNLFILGTMNVADRSLALVDAAIRRRFAFRELRPGKPPVDNVLRAWLREQDLDDEPARLLDALNELVADGESQIGHSYLMRRALYVAQDGQRHDQATVDQHLGLLWETQILPLLAEYHYGQSLDVADYYSLGALLAGLRAVTRADTGP